MKALIQRVSRGNVTVEGQVTGSIGRGFVVLIGVKTGDTEENAQYLAHKTVNLRIFPDKDDKMNLSIMDINGEILVISQFTLYADTKKGNRPSFIQAAIPETAEKLYNEYTNALKRTIGDSRIKTGTFRASMVVEIINDGPVTVELSTDDK
ncbi:MAG: D-aminoacyl-tRNA deacylase [Kiritimatiellae bacterium]|nr:D-aminoacyl-tRNA deacylase [Kiritimatiellia bacterium]MDD5520748.1 D-aminoacyl-tRNA deacylase [Kiritimatiellia bacterium]